MITVGRVKFEHVPEFFIERYDSEIAAWANNFDKIGPVKSFILREGHLADLSPDPEQGAVLIQVKLIAKMSRKGVEIAPHTIRDQRMIALHCEKMERAGMPANGFTKEPERPGLPFMPNISPTPIKPTEH